MSRTYSVYIIECSDSSFYVGITNNIERRLYEHNQGISDDAYTKSRLPVQLKYIANFTLPIEAIAFEKRLKGWTRAKKMALINDNIEKLKDLSRRHPSSGSG
jgi:putative endonuclease